MPGCARVCRFASTIMQNCLHGLSHGLLRFFDGKPMLWRKNREKTCCNRSMSRERLARFVAATRWEDVPPKVRHQAKRSFMNLFAVALAGCRTEPVEIALSSLSEFSGGKQATVIGRAERIDALSAAFLNAAAANVHDFCDTHLRTVIHPTAPVAPALLALAELRKVSGPELLLAFILGNEVQARIGLAISPHHYDRGWHITSTCGVFGAAAGAGKLLGLDEQQTGVRARHRVDAIRRSVRMPGHAGQERQRRQCRAQRPVVGAARGKRF